MRRALGTGDRDTPGTSVPTRTDGCARSLVEAGLVDRVRVGASCPPAEAAPGREPIARLRSKATTPGAEEAFSPDVLLRPHSRGAVRANEGRLIELARRALVGRDRARLSHGRGRHVVRASWSAGSTFPTPSIRASCSARGCGSTTCSGCGRRDLQAALRAAELLIKTGFALVVLDLEGAPARELAQLGASVWTRLAARAARVARHGAPARLAARRGLVRDARRVSTARERALFDAGLFEGLESRLAVLRSRGAASRSESSFAVFRRRLKRSDHRRRARGPRRPRARRRAAPAARSRPCLRANSASRARDRHEPDEAHVARRGRRATRARGRRSSAARRAGDRRSRPAASRGRPRASARARAGSARRRAGSRPSRQLRRELVRRRA